LLTESQQKIALFDFDNTLIKGDSLWPFLILTAGYKKTLKVLFKGMIEHIHKTPKALLFNRDHIRTYIKTYLLHNLLSGKSPDDIRTAVIQLEKWQKWNEEVRNALTEHYAQGHHIVIASGGLNLYLPYLLRDVPHHALLCTEIEIEKDIITGNIIFGNCVRENKADKIRDYMQANGPFLDSWGYGNYPDDVPMLQLVKHRIIIS